MRARFQEMVRQSTQNFLNCAAVPPHREAMSTGPPGRQLRCPTGDTSFSGNPFKLEMCTNCYRAQTKHSEVRPREQLRTESQSDQAKEASPAATLWVVLLAAKIAAYAADLNPSYTLAHTKLRHNKGCKVLN